MRQWIKLFEDLGQQPAIPQTTTQSDTSSIAQPANKNKPFKFDKRKAQIGQIRGQDIALLKQVLKHDYPRFVVLLGKHIRDPKFLEAIKQLAAIDRVDLKEVSVPAINLKPTQNEIDIDKSLSYALKSPESVEKYLQGGPVSVNGPIITAANGQFIVDGHHRWSQVFLCNPKCKINALDMTDISEPMDALKAAQLGIAAATNKVPMQTVEGLNLMTIDEKQFFDYVLRKTVDGVIDVFRKYGIVKSQANDDNAKMEVAKYLWNNVLAMRETNQPVQGAPSRGLMPQTDTAKGQWDDNAPNPETVTEVGILDRIKSLAGIGDKPNNKVPNLSWDAYELANYLEKKYFFEDQESWYVQGVFPIKENLPGKLFSVNEDKTVATFRVSVKNDSISENEPRKRMPGVDSDYDYQRGIAPDHVIRAVDSMKHKPYEKPEPLKNKAISFSQWKEKWNIIKRFRDSLIKRDGFKYDVISDWSKHSISEFTTDLKQNFDPNTMIIVFKVTQKPR